MTTKNVSDALHVFYELNSEFANAYWETNDINSKDLFFAMKSLLQEELDELNKLSIQDHEYPYEPSTPSVVQLSKKLRSLVPELDGLLFRTQTIRTLEDIIPRACELFECRQ